jgi:hypothetical protein
MNRSTRRELLGALGGALALAAAGCADINEGQFVVVQTLYRQHPQADTDVQVEVAIENRRSNDAQGTLTVTLTHSPSNSEEQSWVEVREIDQQKGSSQEYFIRFTNVVRGEFDRNEYSVEATLEEEGGDGDEAQNGENDEGEAQNGENDEGEDQGTDENTTANQ